MDRGWEEGRMRRRRGRRRQIRRMRRRHQATRDVKYKYFVESVNIHYLWTNHIYVRTYVRTTYVLLGRSSDSAGINSWPSGSFENMQHASSRETPRGPLPSPSPCPIRSDSTLYPMIKEPPPSPDLATTGCGDDEAERWDYRHT